MEDREGEPGRVWGHLICTIKNTWKISKTSKWHKTQPHGPLCFFTTPITPLKRFCQKFQGAPKEPGV